MSTIIDIENITNDFSSDIDMIEETISFNVDLLESKSHWKKYVPKYENVGVDWHKAVMGGRFSDKQIDKYANKCEKVCWELYRLESDKWTEVRRILSESDENNVEVLDGILREIDARWLSILGNQRFQHYESGKRQQLQRMVSKADARREPIIIDMLENDGFTDIEHKYEVNFLLL